MFLNSYFYDPVYGYCRCNAVINQYNNKLDLDDDFNCDCVIDIMRFKKSPPPPYKIIEDIKYFRKAEFFPEGFVEILKSEFFYLNMTPIYFISSLNFLIYTFFNFNFLILIFKCMHVYWIAGCCVFRMQI